MFLFKNTCIDSVSVFKLSCLNSVSPNYKNSVQFYLGGFFLSCFQAEKSAVLCISTTLFDYFLADNLSRECNG